jgi:hypothetical protein
MLHIKPITEAEAEPIIREIFQEINSVFKTNTTPIFFRYLANFPEFFEYSWQRISASAKSRAFIKATEQLSELSNSIIKIIYAPESSIYSFAKSLTDAERSELEETVENLSRINSSLMIVSIAIRESLKGVIIEEKKLLGTVNETINREYIKEMGLEGSEMNLGNIERGLLPLEFGGMLVVRYPEFYKLVSLEMLKLAKTEKYLKGRVELERIGQMLIENLEVPISFPFRETIEKIRGREYSEEILYLINGTFPSQYPHHLLTSSVMKQSLNLEEGLTVS